MAAGGRIDMSRRMKRWIAVFVLGLLGVPQAGLATAGCMVNRSDTPRMMGAGAAPVMRHEAAPLPAKRMSPSAGLCLRHCTGKFQLSRQSATGVAEAPLAVSPIVRLRMPRIAWLRPAQPPPTPIPIRILLNSFLI